METATQARQARDDRRRVHPELFGDFGAAVALEAKLQHLALACAQLSGEPGEGVVELGGLVGIGLGAAQGGEQFREVARWRRAATEPLLAPLAAPMPGNFAANHRQGQRNEFFRGRQLIAVLAQT